MKRRSYNIALPPCGIFVGTTIYNTYEDYLVSSGRIHTIWRPHFPSPVETLDKVLEDNLGNMVQYWGFSGGVNAVTFARHCALDELGMEPPLPDWENRRFLNIKDWVNPQDYAHRQGAGTLRLVQEAAKRGLYIQLLYTDGTPEWSRQFRDAGKYYLGYDMGEIFTFRIDEEHLETIDASTFTLRGLADGLMKSVREFAERRHENGWGPIAATSGNFYLDYEIAAGGDMPMVEDFAFRHLNVSSALSRGLVKQFDLPLWGSHLAHEHYSWIPFASPYKFPLFRAAMFIKYMAGSKMILNECGCWALEATLVEDTPIFDTPRVEPGGPINQRDPHLAAHLVEEARKTYPTFDYNSEYPTRYRKELSDFYDYVLENGAPAGQPEVTIGVIKGDLDLSSHTYSPNGVIGGAYTVADANPLWMYGAPERGWNIVKDTFFPRPPVLGPHLNQFLSGTPYGQVDIVSFVDKDLTAEYLVANYKVLLFSGWNTCSPQQYRMLVDYVRSGGILFVSIPQLSTIETRNYMAYTAADLVNGGDFSELCGVKVKGRGRRFYWATAPDKSGKLGFKIGRRFGITTTCLGDIEILDPDMETLVVDDEQMDPLLLRRNVGKGAVYFFNSWHYPGAYDVDEGPGATLDSPGLIGYIYRHLAEQARGTVVITDDGEKPGENCRYVNVSYFPEDGSICLLNIDFDNPRTVYLHQPSGVSQIELAPAEFRRWKMQ